MLIARFAPVLSIKVWLQGILVYIAFIAVAHLIKNIEGTRSFAFSDDMKSRFIIKLDRTFFYTDISLCCGKEAVLHLIAQLLAWFKSDLICFIKFLGKKILKAAAC